MKILLITDNLPPEPASVGKIALNFAQKLRKDNQIFIITTVAKREEEETKVENEIKIFKIYTTLPTVLFLKKRN